MEDTPPSWHKSQSAELRATYIIMHALDGKVPGTLSLERMAHNTKTTLAVDIVTELSASRLLSGSNP